MAERAPTAVPAKARIYCPLPQYLSLSAGFHRAVPCVPFDRKCPGLSMEVPGARAVEYSSHRPHRKDAIGLGCQCESGPAAAAGYQCRSGALLK